MPGPSNLARFGKLYQRRRAQMRQEYGRPLVEAFEPWLRDNGSSSAKRLVSPRYTAFHWRASASSSTTDASKSKTTSSSPPVGSSYSPAKLNLRSLRRRCRLRGHRLTAKLNDVFLGLVDRRAGSIVGPTCQALM
jgi:hypothetical protein